MRVTNPLLAPSALLHEEFAPAGRTDRAFHQRAGGRRDEKRAIRASLAVLGAGLIRRGLLRNLAGIGLRSGCSNRSGQKSCASRKYRRALQEVPARDGFEGVARRFRRAHIFSVEWHLILSPNSNCLRQPFPARSLDEGSTAPIRCLISRKNKFACRGADASHLQEKKDRRTVLYFTTIVAAMKGCNLQRTLYVPGFMNVMANSSPCSSSPLSSVVPSGRIIVTS